MKQLCPTTTQILFPNGDGSTAGIGYVHTAATAGNTERGEKSAPAGRQCSLCRQLDHVVAGAIHDVDVTLLVDCNPARIREGLPYRWTGVHMSSDHHAREQDRAETNAEPHHGLPPKAHVFSFP